ncbi:diphthine synthase [Candidatus Hodarchaeum mangrovi]
MEKQESTLYFIGMGLRGFYTCSLECLDILQKADIIYIEKYTNFILEELPPLMQKMSFKFKFVTREELEEKDSIFLEKNRNKTIALLIPGDPFIATTHISLRITAKKKGFKCQVVHNTSIVSAAASASGLSGYKFGKTVTFPFSENYSDIPYEIIKANKLINAHTLVLLDIDPFSNRFLAINEAIDQLLEIERKKSENVFINESKVIGIAQLGHKYEFIHAGTVLKIKKIHWREIGPPQALIVCAENLHFTEEESLKELWGIEN